MYRATGTYTFSGVPTGISHSDGISAAGISQTHIGDRNLPATGVAAAATGGGRIKAVQIAVPTAIVAFASFALFIAICLCRQHKRSRSRAADSPPPAFGYSASCTAGANSNTDIEHGSRSPKRKSDAVSHVLGMGSLANIYASIANYLGVGRGRGRGCDHQPSTAEDGRAMQRYADWNPLADNWLDSSRRLGRERSAAERLRKISEKNRALRKRDLATRYTQERTIASQYFGWLPGVAKLRPARLGGWAKIGPAGIYVHPLPSFQNTRPVGGMPDDAIVGNAAGGDTEGLHSGIDLAFTRMLPEEHVAEFHRAQLSDAEVVEPPEAVRKPAGWKRGDGGVLPKDFPSPPPPSRVI